MLKDSGIYIAEDLTKEEANIFYIARKMKKNQLIMKAWTEEGSTIIIEQAGSTPRILHQNDPIIAKLHEFESNKTASSEPSPTVLDPTPAFTLLNTRKEDKEENDVANMQENENDAANIQENETSDFNTECQKLIQGIITRSSKNKQSSQQ